MIFFNGRLETACGDITTMNFDAIVNAANSTLLGGGGVDGAIHRAAGPALLEACRKVRKEQYPDGLPAGEAVLTPAGRLPFRGVIHTVGPVWRGGRSGEESLLASCYKNSLLLASEAGFRTLGFPAVSTGVYGYPPELAARAVISLMKKTLPGINLPEVVTLVFYSSRSEIIFLNEAEQILGNTGWENLR